MGEVSVVSEVGVEGDNEIVVAEWQGAACDRRPRYQCHLDTGTGGRRTKWGSEQTKFHNLKCLLTKSRTLLQCHWLASIESRHFSGILGRDGHRVIHS